MNKCPPGVICSGNVTIFSIILLIIAFYFFIVIANKQPGNNKYTQDNNEKNSVGSSFYNLIPNNVSFPFFNASRRDVLLDPHTAPLRDDTVFIRNLHDIRGQPELRAVPINVPTQSVDTEYRQVGILTRTNGPETILPLMGRPLITNRDKWQFYTMSDKNQSVKLPLSNGGKSCTGEYGCDNLGNGDTVFVEGYNDSFKVTSYENNTLRYIPVI